MTSSSGVIDAPVTAPGAAGRIDARGPRFAAWITTVVLAAVILTGSGWLLAAQAAVFAIGAIAGVRHSPFSVVFRVAVRPRLGAPSAFEDAAPLRFAQGVGLLFAVVGTAGFAAGVPALGLTATAFALAAALLNAGFGLCLGCEVYLLLVRAGHGTDSTHPLTSRENEGVTA